MISDGTPRLTRNHGTGRRLIQRYARSPFVVLAVLWVLLWLVPWVIWLNGMPWLRAVAGICIFVAPGMVLSMLLVGERLTLAAHFTSGLAIAVSLVGSLGLVGRIFHLSFALIQIAYALVGLIAILLLVPRARSGKRFVRSRGFSILTLAILLFTMIVGFVTSLEVGVLKDDLSYLAYLTTWQHSASLNFQDVFFGLAQAGQIRFWLSLYPMSVALLAEISGLPGVLLLGYYLEPLLVVIAILAAYNLYAGLLGSEVHAVAALLLQFTALHLLKIVPQPGNLFFFHLTQDKAFAAFILAPAFFLAARCLLEEFVPRRAVFLMLTGMALTLSHPVGLAYSVFIVAIYAALDLLITAEYRKLWILFALLALIVLPAASLRFVGVPWVTRHVFGLSETLQQPGAFDMEAASDTPQIEALVDAIPGTPFYGFDIKRIQFDHLEVAMNPWQGFFSWLYLWVLILGLGWSLLNLKQHASAPFVAATSLLVLLSTIPYTGWLLGYFVTARQLWRTPWLYPFGLTASILIVESLRVVQRRIAASMASRAIGERVILILVSCACVAIITARFANWVGAASGFFKNREVLLTQLTELAELGDYLEMNIDSPSRFLAPQDLMDYLPGLSAKSKVVFFREERFSLERVSPDRLAEVLSPDVSIGGNRRVKTLEQYRIRYVVTPDDSLVDYYSDKPAFTIAGQVGPYTIIEFNPIFP